MQEVNFSKYLYAIVHWMDCSCALVWRFFSLEPDGATAERQIQNRIFGQFLYQFEEGYRRQLCIDSGAVFAFS